MQLCKVQRTHLALEQVGRALALDDVAHLIGDLEHASVHCCQQECRETQSSV